MVACRELGGQKSGLRYIYEVIQVSPNYRATVCLTIYVHQSDIPETEVKATIRDRIADYTVDNVDDGLDLGYSSSMAE